MYQTYRNKQSPIGNPIANVLVVIVGAIAITASVILGVLAFFAIGSIILIMAGIIGIRLWWANRKLLRQSGDPQNRRNAGTADAQVIEGEYQVVTRETERDSSR